MPIQQTLPSPFRVSFPLKKITRTCRAFVFFSALAFQLTLPATAFCELSAEVPVTAQTVQPPSQPHQTFGHMKTFFNDVTKYFGTRYRWGGQTPAGFDCSGFVGFMYDKVFNMRLPRTSREMSAIGTKVDKDQLQPGDLVFFQTRGRGINHVGIFIGANTFVHSSLSRGVVEEQLKQNFYEKQFAGAVRILELPVNKLPVTAPVLSDKVETINPS